RISSPDRRSPVSVAIVPIAGLASDYAALNRGRAKPTLRIARRAWSKPLAVTVRRVVGGGPRLRERPGGNEGDQCESSDKGLHDLSPCVRMIVLGFLQQPRPDAPRFAVAGEIASWP